MNLGKRSIFLALAALVMALAAPLPGADRKAAGSPATPKSVPAKPKPASKPPRAIPLEPVKPVKPVKPASLARDPYLGAIVVDAADGRVLFEERADEKDYPASVLKLMLLLTALEQIDAGKLSLQDDVTVSASAVTREGADLQLKEGEVFKVEDMMYAVMIHSANDVATALAEKLGGSLAGYLEIINRRAQELGMVNSRFVSANGLGPAVPGDPYDVTTPRDLSLLCREIVKHPGALRFTSTQKKMFSPAGGARKIKMETHNYILDTVKGCDGLKTGFIRAAGYCIAGTAQRKGRRVIAVLLGAPSEKARNKTVARLIDQGFATL